jgi:hypothetical protein
LEGLTKRELQYGILSVFKFNKDYSEEFKAWPPNAKEFLMLCRYRPSDFKLLPVNEAFNAARASLNRVSYIWPHITVYLAARDMGVQALASNTNETFYDFKYHYQVYCQQFMAGCDLGMPPNQGFLYKAFSLSEHAETAKKHLAQCYKILNYRGNRC